MMCEALADRDELHEPVDTICYYPSRRIKH